MARAYLGSSLRSSVSRAVAIVAGGCAFTVLVYLFELACSVRLAGGN